MIYVQRKKQKRKINDDALNDYLDRGWVKVLDVLPASTRSKAKTPKMADLIVPEIPDPTVTGQEQEEAPE